jgi:AcrR family transcriptional regulator
MPRLSRQQIDDEIVGIAANLFARHGFAETSVQRIADAAGFSKGGLLRHFPSKEALQAEVISRCIAELQAAADPALSLPSGASRDRAALTGLTHLALRRPGFVALLLSGLARGLNDPENAVLQPITTIVTEMFELTPQTGLDRLVRVAGAVGGLAVARISLGDQLTPAAESHLVTMGMDALGHTGTN